MGSTETMQVALDGYEGRLRARGVPVDRILLPGLPNSEIDSLTAGLPFQLSDEMRTFYQWRNGSTEERSYCYLPGVRYLSTLVWAVSDYDEWRFSFSTDRYEFRETWFPLNSRDGRTLAADCGVAAGEPSPLYYANIKGSEAWDEVCSQSFAEMVYVWNRMLDEDYWTYDTETGEWTERFASIPVDLRLRHLV